MGSIAVFIPFVVLVIPILAIVLSFKDGARKTRIKELELQKEILELEVKKQEGKIKLLEQENKNLDKIIYEKQ